MQIYTECLQPLGKKRRAGLPVFALPSAAEALTHNISWPAILVRVCVVAVLNISSSETVEGAVSQSLCVLCCIVPFIHMASSQSSTFMARCDAVPLALFCPVHSILSLLTSLARMHCQVFYTSCACPSHDSQSYIYDGLTIWCS